MSTNVLVVEDYLDSAKLLEMMLKTCGYTVCLAPDGPAAINAARKLVPDFVLLDIGLPGMDGYEVAKRLRRDVGLVPPVKIIALSGFQPNEEKQAESGIDHHMMKPLDLKELLGLVRC